MKQIYNGNQGSLSRSLVKMTAVIFTALFFSTQVLFAHNMHESAEAQDENSAKEDINELLHYYEKQIYFTENKGQFNPKVKFRADFPLGQAVVTDEGMYVSAYDHESVGALHREGEDVEFQLQNGGAFRTVNTGLKGHTWMMNFLNRSSSMTISGKDQHADFNNYFSNELNQSKVYSYGEIWYNNVYNNVDVRYYPSAEGELEYDIICKPGFNPSDIAIRFDGIEEMSVTESGTLILKTSVGAIEFPAPIVYQKINGVKKNINSKYKLSSGNKLSFALEAYDKASPLIIDPIALRWASWINTASAGDNHGHCIWVDPSDGAIYVVARVVGSTDQITPGAFNLVSNGNLDMIIGKYLEPVNIGQSGTRVWQTYLGGSGDDNPYAMEQGPDGHLYITGYTTSPNFPLLGGSAFSGVSIDQRNSGGQNIFITKMTTDGLSIKSSVIGGAGDEGSFDLRINEVGDIVICGNHNSNNLGTLYPGTGALDRANSNNGNDVLVFKILQDLSGLVWMKNYGGSSADQATIMSQNVVSGDIFIGGYTSSNNFPTLNARQSTIGGTQSGFLQKLNSSGTTVWSSYFQSASTKSTSILCMDFNVNKDELYFGGITSGLAASNISANSVYDNQYNNGTNDFYVCRMDIDQNFLAATYLGGSANEVNMMGLNVDLNNDVYIFGYTNSTNFPTSTAPSVPLQTTNNGSNDKTFSKLSSDLSTLMFSTYFGGSGDDYDPVGERGIKFSNCRIYTIVTSESNNLPLTQGALNTTRSSSNVYEPGLVVWANPPDLLGNSITGNQTVCAGTVPGDITGSVPAYVLPTIVRNTTTSTYPALGAATTYQWQISTDSTNWTNIPNATAQNLAGADIGQLFTKTYFRRIIGGDACILAGAADQVVTVKVVTISSNTTNVSCNGEADGSLTAISDGVSPFQYQWSTGSVDQTISNLSPGTYSVFVTDAEGCSASNSFTITEPLLVTANAGTDQSITCVGTVQLNGSSNLQTIDFSWSTANGNIVSGANSATAVVDQAGTYILTATNTENGCTGTDTVEVTSITQNTSSTANITICDGETYTPPGGNEESANGTFVTVIPNVAGCDSTITTNLTVLNPITSESSESICSNQTFSFPWGGSTSTPGDYMQTYTSVDGCDSVVTIHLSVSQSIQTSTNESICSGGSFNLPWGGTASVAGNYPHTYTSVSGCDSIATIILSITQGVSSNTNASICQGESFQFPWGGSASNAGDYPHTYQGVNGCDSIATIHLTIRQGTSSTTNASICQGAFYQFPWGGSANAAGDYPHTYTGENGCDSIATIHLTLTSAYYTEVNESICDGETFVLPWGGYEGYPGDYTYTYEASNGCDSVVTIHLTVRPVDHTQTTVNICQGASYHFPWGGSTTVAGYFPHGYTSVNGCDSIVTIRVTVGGTISCNISVSGCHNNNLCSGQAATLSAPSGMGYTYLWSTGATTRTISVNTSGTYSVTVRNASGCTSTCSQTIIAGTRPMCTITTTGCHNNSICGGQSATLCAPAGQGYTYLWSNGATSRCISVNTPGNYSVTVTNASGCSNTCNKVISAGNPPNCSITVSGCSNNTICSGQTATLSAAYGSGYTYRWGNGSTSRSINVTQGGTYTVTVTNSNGCSSTCSKTITVTQGPNCSISGNTSICRNQSTTLSAPSGSGYSYLWSTGSHSRTISVNHAGTYTVRVTKGGCTSTCSVNVTQLSSPSSTITGNTLISRGQNTTLCGPSGQSSYRWSTGATTRCITTCFAGNYSLTVTNSNGCTSSSTVCVRYRSFINCRIIADPRTGEAVAEITGGTPPYSIIWNNDPELNQGSIRLNESGEVNLTVTDSEGQEEKSKQMVFLNYIQATAYPVPAVGSVTIEFKNFGKTSFTTVDIYRADGSLVKRLFNSDATTNATNRVVWNVGEIREGIYFYRISNGDNSANGTLVIQN